MTAFATHALAKGWAYELVYGHNYGASPTDLFVDTDPGSPWPTGGPPDPPDDSETQKAFATDALCREAVADWWHGFATNGSGPDHTWADPDSSPDDGPTDPSPPASPASEYDMKTWALMWASKTAFNAIEANDDYAKYANIKVYVSDMWDLMLVGIRVANGAKS